MDGGTVWNINVDSAVLQCFDMGFAEEDIIMDVVIIDYTYVHPGTVHKNAAENFATAMLEKLSYHSNNSI